MSFLHKVCVSECSTADSLHVFLPSRLLHSHFQGKGGEGRGGGAGPDTTKICLNYRVGGKRAEVFSCSHRAPLLRVSWQLLALTSLELLDVCLLSDAADAVDRQEDFFKQWPNSKVCLTRVVARGSRVGHAGLGPLRCCLGNRELP